MADEDTFWLQLVLRVSDVLWTCFVLTPLTIFFWGGTWKLIDIFVFPDDDLTSSVVSLAIGTTVCLAGYLLLPLLNWYCPPPTQTYSVKHIIISRIGLYVLAIGVLNYWRGIWQLMDYYVGNDSLMNGLCVGVSGFLLMCLRALGNVISTPFAQELDNNPKIYKPVTRFKVQPDQFFCYLADVLLSHLVISHLVVQVWRGLWNLMEGSILPSDVLLSYCVSIGTGYGGAFILFILQQPLTVIANRLTQLHWIAMLLFQDVVHVPGVLVTLLIWRGGWGLNRDYLLENAVEAAAAHGIASVGLLLCQVMSSVSTLNISVDADGNSTSGFYYGIHYFWYIWRRYRLRSTGTLQVQVDRDENASRGLLADSDDELITAVR